MDSLIMIPLDLMLIFICRYKSALLLVGLAFCGSYF
uniref:Uncharacterized protein n=1 Tax=Rhizophora mucronata TaxID=61149 RepID=A0A2P2PS65_RHIMU